MSNSVDFDGRPFHFIGVGGIGMSALAYVLVNKQLPVSGSDKHPNHITKRLESIGVNILIDKKLIICYSSSHQDQYPQMKYIWKSK